MRSCGRGSGRRAPYPAEVKERVLALWREGHSRREIAEITGVCYDTARYFIYRECGAERKSTPPYPEEVRERVHALCREGHSRREIAEITGVCYGTVRFWILHYGWSDSGRVCHPKEVREQARNLYDRGYGAKEIAEITGVKVGTVRQWGSRGEWAATERQTYPPESRERVHALWRAGYNPREIFWRTDVCPSTISRWVRQGGWQRDVPERGEAEELRQELELMDAARKMTPYTREGWWTLSRLADAEIRKIRQVLALDGRFCIRDLKAIADAMLGVRCILLYGADIRNIFDIAELRPGARVVYVLVGNDTIHVGAETYVRVGSEQLRRQAEWLRECGEEGCAAGTPVI